MEMDLLWVEETEKRGCKRGLYMLKAGTRGIYNRFEITHMSLKTLHPSVVRIKSQRRVKMGILLRFRARLFQHWATAFVLYPVCDVDLVVPRNML